MLLIIVFIEAANALSAGVAAGFVVIVMPFVSSARRFCDDGKTAVMIRVVAISVDIFIVVSPGEIEPK